MAKQLIGSGCHLGGEQGQSSDGCIRWGGDSRREGCSFGGKCGASHCNQWELCGIVILCREGWRCGCSQITLGFLIIIIKEFCYSAFSAPMLLVGWHTGHPACKKSEWWDAGVVMCLGQGAGLHMAQLMPLPLTISCFSKSRLVLPFSFYLCGAGSPG